MKKPNITIASIFDLKGRLKGKKKMTKKHKVLTFSVVVLVLAGFGWWYTHRDGTPAYETDTVVRKDVLEEVDVTGMITPAQDISLSFEQSGRVTGIPVAVGTHVAAGQSIAFLGSADMQAQLDGAIARRDAVQADLEKLLEGTRPEQLAVSAAQVEQSAESLVEAKGAVYDVMADAFTRADGAVRGTTDQFFNNPRTTNPALIFVTTEGSVKNDVERRRVVLEQILTAWEVSIAARDNADATLAKRITEVEGYQTDVQTFLQKMSAVVNDLQTMSNLPQTTIDGYKAAVASARTSVNASISSFSSAKASYVAANQALNVMRSQYDLQKAPATDATIKAARAQVAAADAQVAQYRAMIGKSVIAAPIAGTITDLAMKLGETVVSGKEVARLISTGRYEIETHIPEADIVKIRIGQSATFTLDAYDDSVVFNATVVMIDPAETVIEGVSTYKVTLQFTDNEEKVRSGMTANVTILTEKKENVLAVPARSIDMRDDGQSFVRVQTPDGTAVERLVTPGLHGSDGWTEVSGDLAEGESVILFEKK
ncbi:MAG: efflux RND transporter periplasmic adaptor subunit [Candidatus Yonathbacteria bacterium]|nr:efflux RND transporter periplasmic adaptor subunit [Candidatus Yonathbacteria bacterium]